MTIFLLEAVSTWKKPQAFVTKAVSASTGHRIKPTPLTVAMASEGGSAGKPRSIVNTYTLSSMGTTITAVVRVPQNTNSL